MRRFRLLGMLAGLIACAAIAIWLGRDFLRAKYFVYRLNNADDSELESWVEQSPQWGAEVAPALLAQMIVDDPDRCRRAGAALTRLNDSDSSTALAGLITARFDSLSPAGQDWALQQVAMRDRFDADARRLIESALKSSTMAIREQAVRAASMSQCSDLLSPLVNDPDIEVRRAVVLALGPHREWLSDDDLLPRLHDADREVQRMTRLALRSRGLTDDQVRFGRLLTDPNPAARLDLIVHLRGDSELDLSEWLTRLSRDPSPAVRVAAARTAADLRIFQLIGRLTEVASSDPEHTVRGIVRFHLNQLHSVQRATEP